jgi:hypothetical protein
MSSFTIAVSAYEDCIEDSALPGARNLLAAITIVDVLLKEAKCNDKVLFLFLSFYYQTLSGRSYDWSNLDDKGNVPKELLTRFRNVARELADQYLAAQALKEVGFVDFLEELGLIGEDAIVDSDDLSDISQLLFIAKILVGKYHKEYAEIIGDSVHTVVMIFDCLHSHQEYQDTALMSVETIGEAYLLARQKYG